MVFVTIFLVLDYRGLNIIKEVFLHISSVKQKRNKVSKIPVSNKKKNKVSYKVEKEVRSYFMASLVEH